MSLTCGRRLRRLRGKSCSAATVTASLRGRTHLVRPHAQTKPVKKEMNQRSSTLSSSPSCAQPFTRSCRNEQQQHRRVSWYVFSPGVIPSRPGNIKKQGSTSKKLLYCRTARLQHSSHPFVCACPQLPGGCFIFSITILIFIFIAIGVSFCNSGDSLIITPFLVHLLILL